LAHLATDETINELDRDWLRQAEVLVGDDSAESGPATQPSVPDIIADFLNAD
jgi:hypothetical protein